MNKQMAFPFQRTAKTVIPDMRRFLGLMKNIKTPVCGRRLKAIDGVSLPVNNCEWYNGDCHAYCVRNVTKQEELTKFPEEI